MRLWKQRIQTHTQGDGAANAGLSDADAPQPAQLLTSSQGDGVVDHTVLVKRTVFQFRSFFHVGSSGTVFGKHVWPRRSGAEIERYQAAASRFAAHQAAMRNLLEEAVREESPAQRTMAVQLTTERPEGRLGDVAMW